MTHYIHMQDQVTNRIDDFMQDRSRKLAEIEDFVQTVLTLAIVIVFLAFGLSW